MIPFMLFYGCRHLPHLLVRSCSYTMATSVSATCAKPFQAAAARPSRQCRHRAATVAVRAQHPQQEQAKQVHTGPLDRRALLLASGAILAGAALQQAQPAAADEVVCNYQTASNGLRWCDLVVGDGEAPVEGALIKAHYIGRLASNGAVFDSSYDRGRPLTFTIGVRQVIPGWDIGILGNDEIPPMKAGGTRKLIIPAELAYGDRGAGGVIPPKSVLDFTVEYVGSAYGRK